MLRNKHEKKIAPGEFAAILSNLLLLPRVISRLFDRLAENLRSEKLVKKKIRKMKLWGLLVAALLADGKLSICLSERASYQHFFHSFQVRLICFKLDSIFLIFWNYARFGIWAVQGAKVEIKF